MASLLENYKSVATKSIVFNREANRLADLIVKARRCKIFLQNRISNPFWSFESLFILKAFNGVTGFALNKAKWTFAEAKNPKNKRGY